MTNVVSFRNRVREIVASRTRVSQWTPGEACSYVSAISARRETFERRAQHLTQSVVLSRLGVVAAMLPNTAGCTVGAHTASCRLEWSPRLPASAVVEFSIEHDLRCEHLVVVARVVVIPRLLRLIESDRLTMPLAAVDEAAIEEWVESKLLEFLNEYLRIDTAASPN